MVFSTFVYSNNIYLMQDLRLSPHFTLSEFERSATAQQYGIDNTVPSSLIPNLINLCKTVLEPLREYVVASSPLWGDQRGAIIISSGYRCNQLNIKVGGVYASQHTLGEAADIQLPKTLYTDWADDLAHTDMSIAHKWFDFLEHHTDFDQLILETSNGRDYWIHVSCRKNLKANRHQVIRNMRKR